MSLLVLAALIWLLIHIGVAGTQLRDLLVTRLGDTGFRGVFSLLSLLSLALLIWTWSLVWSTPLWYAPDWLRWLLAVVMLPAFLLFVAAVAQPNPTAAGGDQVMARPPRSIIRVTRHPMLWSFTLWAAVHIIGNGDSAATVFFGTFLATSLIGMPSIDGKLARRDPATWHTLAASTSIVPFAAIAQGRNRFVPREIGWLTPLIAVAAWAALLHLHPWLFSVPPVAM